MTTPALEHAPALRLVDVRRSFAQGQTRLTVLDGVSLSLKRGEIVALVGPSGAGKSTLLQIAGLMERPSSGEVLISGRACGRLPDAVRTGLRRRRIGFVFQYHHLLPEFSALENIVLPQMIAGKSHREAVERARILLDIVGLSRRARHRPGRLSGGEQQRVAVARALANRPLILLADEPTGNLDSRTAGKVFEELVNLVRRGGLAALIATHNMDLAKRMDRALMLESGLLVEADVPRSGVAWGVDASVPEWDIPFGTRAESGGEDTEAATGAEPPLPEPEADAEVAPAPAWRRVDALGLFGADADEDEAGAATRPEAEDKAESLLHILHAVERMAQQHRSQATRDRGHAAGDVAPEEDEVPPSPWTAEAAEPGDGVPAVPPESAAEPAREMPPDAAEAELAFDRAGVAEEAGWEEEITIPEKAAYPPSHLLSRDLPEAAAEGPPARGDDLPVTDPVDLPAFIKKRRRGDDGDDHT